MRSTYARTARRTTRGAATQLASARGSVTLRLRRGPMTGKTAIVVGLIAGACVLATDARARDPVTAPAAQTVAVKKPAPKRPVRPSREDTDPMAAVPVFSAEAVGWRLVEDPATGARLGVPQKLVPHISASRSGNRWTSTQGQIQVETFRLTEASLPALFEDEKKASRRQIASSVLKPDSLLYCRRA